MKCKKGKKYCQREVHYNVLLIHIQFDDCIPTIFCICPNQTNATKWKIFNTITPFL